MASSTRRTRRTRREFRSSAIRFRPLAAAAATVLVTISAGAASALMITEVQFDPVAFGSDLGQEFVEIYNDGGTTLDLTGYSIGWGATSYTDGTHDLDLYGAVAGSMAPGEVIVISGPSDTTGYDFAPELANGFLNAAGVGIFDVESGSIAGATPVDSLIYGTFFVFGVPAGLGGGPVDVVTANSTQNAVRDAGGNWTTTTTPTPGYTPVPEPGSTLLLGLGLIALSAGRRAVVASA